MLYVHLLKNNTWKFRGSLLAKWYDAGIFVTHNAEKWINDNINNSSGFLHDLLRRRKACGERVGKGYCYSSGE